MATVIHYQFLHCVICSRVRKHYKQALRCDSSATELYLLSCNLHRLYLPVLLKIAIKNCTKGLIIKLMSNKSTDFFSSYKVDPSDLFIFWVLHKFVKIIRKDQITHTYEPMIKNCQDFL